MFFYGIAVHLCLFFLKDFLDDISKSNQFYESMKLLFLQVSINKQINILGIKINK